MSKNHSISMRMDARLYECAKASHERFNQQMFEHFGLPALSFNGFLEVCINEHLSRSAPDLHDAAFKRPDEATDTT